MRYFAHIILLFTLLGVPIYADAAPLEICNETSYVMQFSIATRYSASTQSEGWDYVFPSSCIKSGEDIPTNAFTYIYARSDIRAYIGDGIVISGNEPFCMASPNEKFKIKGRENCRARGYDEIDFALAAGAVSFSEPSNYGEKRSLMAARQRLLDVLGYAPGPIDGYGGRRTRSATQSYLRTNKLSRNIEEAELIRRLHTSAIKTRNSRGLTLCNKIDNPIWAATGEPYGNGYRSAGWLHIEQNKCVRVIRAPLLERYYYIYAEAVTQNETPLIADAQVKKWGGDFALCTKPTRFVIDEQDNCTERGLDQHSFIRIDTGNQRGWTHNLK